MYIGGQYFHFLCKLLKLSSRGFVNQSLFLILHYQIFNNFTFETPIYKTVHGRKSNVFKYTIKAPAWCNCPKIRVNVYSNELLKQVVNGEYLICCTIYKYSLGVIPDCNATG